MARIKNLLLRVAFSGLFIRTFFILFGLSVSWAVVSMGVDILLAEYNTSVDTKYLYFLDGYSTAEYKKYLILAQELYLFELILSLLGITPQSFITSSMQIGSRVFISRYACGDTHLIITSIMILAWGISDSIRFLYYACLFLKKIRYLASIVLYPVGIVCEIVLMVYMKNILTVIGMLTYIPGSVYLYGRIRGKRKRVLAEDTEKIEREKRKKRI